MSSSLSYIRKGIAFVAILFAGAFVGSYLASIVEQAAGQIEFAVPAWYVLFPSLVVLAFMAILIHELGHVAGGLAARFRFVMLIVGPLKVALEKEKLTFGLNRWVHLSGGMALCIPDEKLDTARGFFMYIAGGPVASLIAALTCALLAIFFHSPTYADPWIGYAVFYLVCSAFFNGGIALVTLLPLPTEGYDNDGKQLLDLIRGGRRVKRKYLLQALSAESIRGLRPCNWSVNYVQEMIAMQSGEPDKMDITCYLIAYLLYLDRGDTTTAGSFIDKLHAQVAGASSVLQPSIWLEVVFFHARYRKDVVLDAAQYTYEGPFIEKHAIARVEASLLAASGKLEQAAQRAKEGIALSKGATLQAGVATAEAEWMQQIIDEIESVSTADTAANQ